jgi:hypothetical protein
MYIWLQVKMSNYRVEYDIITNNQMPRWITPLGQTRQNDRNGYIICILWSSDAKDMKQTNIQGTMTLAVGPTSDGPRVHARHVVGADWPPPGGASTPWRGLLPRAGVDRSRGLSAVASSQPARHAHAGARARMRGLPIRHMVRLEVATAGMRRLRAGGPGQAGAWHTETGQ